MFRTRTAAGVLAGISSIALLAGCAGGSGGEAADDKGSAENPVVIGVIGAGDPYWETYVDAAAEEGITVEIEGLSDYSQPNPALSEGDLDLNQFQHTVFLAQYNADAGDDLQPIGSTAVYPLGLYSTAVDSVDEIGDGDTVAVSNDPANQARALLILQEEGLIELAGGGSPFSTLADIEDSSTVEVTALAPDLLGPSLPDVAAAFINNDFVEDSGLTYDDAIAKDDPTADVARPYVNIFAARDDEKDTPVYQDLVRIFQENQDVLDGVQEVNGGTAEFVTIEPQVLQDELAQVEEDYQASK